MSTIMNAAPSVDVLREMLATMSVAALQSIEAAIRVELCERLQGECYETDVPF